MHGRTRLRLLGAGPSVVETGPCHRTATAVNRRASLRGAQSSTPRALAVQEISGSPTGLPNTFCLCPLGTSRSGRLPVAAREAEIERPLDRLGIASMNDLFHGCAEEPPPTGTLSFVPADPKEQAHCFLGQGRGAEAPGRKGGWGVRGSGAKGGASRLHPAPETLHTLCPGPQEVPNARRRAGLMRERPIRDDCSRGLEEDERHAENKQIKPTMGKRKMKRRISRHHPTLVLPGDPSANTKKLECRDNLSIKLTLQAPEEIQLRADQGSCL